MTRTTEFGVFFKTQNARSAEAALAISAYLKNSFLQINPKLQSNPPGGGESNYLYLLGKISSNEQKTAVYQLKVKHDGKIRSSHLDAFDTIKSSEPSS